MPSLVERIGKMATDLGAKVNVLKNGAGKKKKVLKGILSKKKGTGTRKRRVRMKKNM